MKNNILEFVPFPLLDLQYIKTNRKTLYPKFFSQNNRKLSLRRKISILKNWRYKYLYTFFFGKYLIVFLEDHPGTFFLIPQTRSTHPTKMINSFCRFCCENIFQIIMLNVDHTMKRVITYLVYICISHSL